MAPHTGLSSRQIHKRVLRYHQENPDRYVYSGHGVLLEKVTAEWQDTVNAARMFEGGLIRSLLFQPASLDDILLNYNKI
jgi:hypothetical protein